MARNPEPISYIKIGNVEHPIDAVTINGKSIPEYWDSLPSVDSEDNGKILMVLQGQWTVYDPYDLYEDFNGIVVDGGSGPHDYSKDYLTLEVLDGGTIKWNAIGDNSAKTISYSLNEGSWTQITSTAAGVTINVSAGDKIRLKGSNTTYATSNTVFSGFGGGEGVTGTATFDVSGNIMSLIYGDYFANQTALTGEFNFCCLFDGSNAVSAENLILPSMTLTPHCYRALFANCAYFTTAPALPATTIAESCYRFMFSADNLLTSVPSILPATTLYKECYYGMFNSCRALTTAPELPATTLTTSCYKQMFMTCSSLTYIKCLATNISVGSPTTDWVKNVAASGTFVKSHEMSSWTVGANGIPTGWVATDDIITVSDPVISFTNNTITISCSTTGAVIYYRLGTTGSFQVYSSPIEISENTHVEAYASISDVDSSTVTYDCTYVPDAGDSDSDSDYGDSDSDYGDSDSDYGDSDSDEPVEHDYSLDYLTFNVLTGGNILWKSIGSGQEKTISYSINDGEWTSITATSSGTVIPVSVGDVVRFKGTNSTYAKDKSNYSGFDGGTATYNVEGNMMSLIYGDNFVGNNTLSGTYNFCSIFKQSKAVSAENMILPATTLTNYCYRAMFSLAPNLITPPALPATTLAQGCYWYMFESCPMSTAPDLLAETIVQEAYGHMFTGCSNLNYIKCLATTKSASKCLEGWVNNVAATGTFVKDANTSWSTGNNGIPTGWVVYNGEILYEPVISFNDEDRITITCNTDGADIYYRLNSGSYTLYNGTIVISEDTVIDAYSSKNNQQSSVVSESCTYVEHKYKFAGLQISQGPLYYGSNGYEIKNHWNYDSYNSVYGKSEGSYYFSYQEMGELFEKSGFTMSDGDIENSIDPLDGWRLPTITEFNKIVGTNRRNGSTVNGSTNKHYALIGLTGVTHRGSSTPFGLLLFPDDETITGDTLTNMDNTTINTGITEAQLNTYISQGCVFLPASGFYYSNPESPAWAGGGYYWSSINVGSTRSYYLDFTQSSIMSNNRYDTSYDYYTVRLVKDTTYGEETPLEGATKDLNDWVI